MWKKHKIDFFICGISAVGVIAFVLFLVLVCELLGIHVPGSREMWIGFAGAVIGGIFTLKIFLVINIFKICHLHILKLPLLRKIKEVQNRESKSET